MQLAANAADEVHQDDVEAAPPDLDAEREGAVGIERQRDGGLADATAFERFAAKQSVALELADDLGDGRRRQSGEPGNRGARQGTVLADERQDEPLIVEAYAGLIGAAPEGKGTSLGVSIRSACLWSLGSPHVRMRAARPPLQCDAASAPPYIYFRNI